MRFDLTDEQRAIREAVHDLCASRYGIEAARRAADGATGDALWPELAKSGWAGLGVAERHGGQGLGVLELALVVEELGYALAPAAFLGNAAAGLLVAAAGTEQQQVGRPIGAYQAVSHRCADMLVAIESARSAVLSAAWTADHQPDQLAFAASVAKALAGDAAWHATASALQIHGGIGFTWEHPIHLFLRRAAASSRFLGSVDEHLERAAELGGLGGETTAAVAAELSGAARRWSTRAGTPPAA